MNDVVWGLDYLHMNLIMHRDIKPDNILIIGTFDKWRAVIIDFNYTIELCLNKSTQYCGTEGYMAQEVVKNGYDPKNSSPYSYEADIYSCG